MIEDELTFKIIGCAMKVHGRLGNGFQEVIYQRCLAIEMSRVGLSHAREVNHPVFYDGVEVGYRRADFIIERTVILEIKAVIALDDVHLSQARNYTVAYDYPIGLLINFGGASLQYKRIFNPRYQRNHPHLRTPGPES